jgi:hypothetical protein
LCLRLYRAAYRSKAGAPFPNLQHKQGRPLTAAAIAVEDAAASASDTAAAAAAKVKSAASTASAATSDAAAKLKSSAKKAASDVAAAVGTRPRRASFSMEGPLAGVESGDLDMQKKKKSGDTAAPSTVFPPPWEPPSGGFEAFSG